MKKLLLLLIIAYSSLASAQVLPSKVFTAVASGDWQAATTWGTTPGQGVHLTYPGMTDVYSGGPSNGDFVDLHGFNVTCGLSTGEICSVGASNTTTTPSVANCAASPAAIVGLLSGSKLTVSGTSTLIYAGLVCLRFGSLVANAGAKIYHDSSWALTPTGYVFTDNDGTNTNTTGWCLGDSGCGATAGSTPILWEGDSQASPNSCRLSSASCNTHCTTVNTSGCTAGTLAGNAGLSIVGEGAGTVTNVVFQNIATGGTFWGWRSGASGTLKFTNSKWTNIGSLGMRTGGGTSNAILDGINCTAPTNNTISISAMTSPSNITIKNSWLECGISPTTPYFGAVTVINSVLKIPWSSGPNFIAGSQNWIGGFSASHQALTDQSLFYSDQYNAGATELVASQAMITTSLQAQNNVIQVNRNLNNTANHLHPITNPKTPAITAPTNPNFWYAINNVYSAFGSLSTTPSTDGNQQGNSSGGVALGPTAVINWTIEKSSGNVMTCGVYGRSTMAGIADSYNSQSFVTNGNGGSALSITVSPATPSSGSVTFTAGSSIFGSFPANANFYLYAGGSTENVNNIGPFLISSNTGTTLVASDPGNVTVSQTVTGIPAWSWWGAGVVKIASNTICSSIGNLTTAGLNGGGYIGTESGGSSFGAVDANANLFFRADAPGTGSVPSYGSYETTSGVGHANFTNNPSFGGVPMAHSVIYNAEVNGRAADSSVAPCINTSPTLSCTFAVIKPTTSTDMILVNQAPQLVDPTRNFVDFGLYLDRNRLFPGGQNAATFYNTIHTIDLGNDNSIPASGSGVGQHQGATTVNTTAAAAWSSGTTYVPGNIVWVDGSITSPVDYSKSLLGRRSYWICKYGHVASASNAPILGIDTSNPFQGPTMVWEDAWLTLWLKPAILAQNASSSTANTYGTSIFTDGSLPTLFNSPTTYAVGLINRYIRQGFVNDDARLWGYQTGTNQCNTSSGGGASTQVECGGVTKPEIQHIYPPVVTN